jgi:hypothetical protein
VVRQALAKLKVRDDDRGDPWDVLGHQRAVAADDGAAPARRRFQRDEGAGFTTSKMIRAGFRSPLFGGKADIERLWFGNWIRQSGSQRILGSFNNAAVGTALGQANGIQALDRSRQVIALTGDGGFNMLMGEFMMAVHHKLPVKVIIYNNSRLGLIFLEAEGVGLPAFREAIEFRNPNFVSLARACGAHGFKAGHPDELRGAIAEALAVDGPAIVDCVVVPDRLPNMPHIDLGLAKNYAIAKIKEAVIAATGR